MCQGCLLFRKLSLPKERRKNNWRELVLSPASLQLIYGNHVAIVPGTVIEECRLVATKSQKPSLSKYLYGYPTIQVRIGLCLIKFIFRSLFLGPDQPRLELVQRRHEPVAHQHQAAECTLRPQAEGHDHWRDEGQQGQNSFPHEGQRGWAFKVNWIRLGTPEKVNKHRLLWRCLEDIAALPKFSGKSFGAWGWWLDNSALLEPGQFFERLCSPNWYYYLLERAWESNLFNSL